MREMTRAACDRVLREVGYGMLALEDEGQPYVVPMSFGYDGEDCFIQMTTTGRKNDALAANPRVSLAVLTTDYETGISESVIVEGTMSTVAEEEEERAGLRAMAGNAEFGVDLEVWGEPIQEVDLGLYRLSVENVSGRRFGPDQSPA